jgi:hypothetical protein
MPKQVEVYTLEELEAKSPEAYARVHERRKNHCREGIPWTQETPAGLVAVVRACGGDNRYTVAGVQV